MKVKFIKTHPIGIEVGKVVTVDKVFGEKLIKEGYAELFKEKVSPIKTKREKAVVVTKEEKSVVKTKVAKSPVKKPKLK